MNQDIEPKERPILFSCEMIKSILEGRKTMTRRTRGLDKINENPNKFKPYERICRSSSGKQFAIGFLNKATKENTVVNVPYGYIGDVVYVKETFKPSQFAGNRIEGFDYKADHALWLEKNGQIFTKNSGCEYEAGKGYTERWKPSLFMPKQAARIFLEIIDVRVERLQEISQDDCLKEGITMNNKPHTGWYWMENVYSTDSPTHGFKCLWQKINGIESWNTNPFVFAYSFKVISTTGKR